MRNNQNETYTQRIQRNILPNNSDLNNENLDDIAIEFLTTPDSFRPFDKGLIDLFKRKDVTKDSQTPNEMAEYLIKKLKEIYDSIKNDTTCSKLSVKYPLIGDDTIHYWFSGKRRPKIEPSSRPKIYQICFALELSYEETTWFFQHVYYDRAFNCHTINEAVFYYAFLHKLSYKNALAIIEEIKQAPAVSPLKTSAEDNYTYRLQEDISTIRSSEDLKNFLIENKPIFGSWNQTTLTKLKSLKEELLPTKEGKSKLNQLKKELNQGKKLTDAMLDNYTKDTDYGLLMQEAFYDANHSSEPNRYIWETIEGRNTTTDIFLLNCLLTKPSGFSRTATDIPYIVRNNFPSKKVLSDVLSEEKVTQSKSYDSIRKTLILLDFFRFWIHAKIEQETSSKTSNDEEANLKEIYLDEANDFLTRCGYEELYAGNPYEWIFLRSIQSDDPLAYFRSFISDLLYIEDDK